MPIEQLRNMLLIGLVLVGFLIWQAWQEDYGPKPGPDPASQDGARALLLTGAGRGFCAGADLSEPPPLDDNGKLDLGKALDERYHPALEALFGLDIPVITAINGIPPNSGRPL